MSLMTDSAATNSLVFERLTANTADQWDEYVRSAENGLPLHLSGWRQVMEDTYGYDTRYHMVRDGEQIRGVLPIFLVPSRLTGKRAMTLPGGICADDEETAGLLLNKAWQTVGKDIDRLLLQDSRQNWPGDWHTESQHVTWLVKLGESEEDLWKQLDGNMRRQVRKAGRNELKIEIRRDERLIEPFYDMFSRFTHQVGTPAFGISFLRNIAKTFPNGYNIALVWHEGQAIAGYFQLEMNNTVYGMWGAALPATLKLRPAYLAIWEIMADAIRHGFTHLDMGRSPADANASKFKGQWGGQSNPIYQTIIMNEENEHSHSITNQVQSDGRLQLFMQIWPRLPLAMTRFLGPKLRWHIPFA